MNQPNVITARSAIAFYLDWVNNWITTEKMAEWYEMPKEDCEYLIELGRKLNEEKYHQSFKK